MRRIRSRYAPGAGALREKRPSEPLTACASALAGGVLQQDEGPHDRHVGARFNQAAADRLRVEHTDRDQHQEAGEAKRLHSGQPA